MRLVPPAEFRLLTEKAALGGAEATPLGWAWRVSGSCTQPVTVTFRQDGLRRRYGDIFVPCRKCGRCLAKRTASWANRAAIEWAQNPRTWFGTLTFRPDLQARWEEEADEWTRRVLGQPLDELSNAKRAFTIARWAGREVTAYYKRLRHEGPFRHMTVCEPHKSGRPHYHCLIHEQGGQIPKRRLDAHWRALGFSAFRLADDPSGLWYIAKYLSKATGSRVRASRAYGKQTLLGLGREVARENNAPQSRGKDNELSSQQTD